MVPLTPISTLFFSEHFNMTQVIKLVPSQSQKYLMIWAPYLSVPLRSYYWTTHAKAICPQIGLTTVDASQWGPGQLPAEVALVTAFQLSRILITPRNEMPLGERFRECESGSREPRKRLRGKREEFISEPVGKTARTIYTLWASYHREWRLQTRGWKCLTSSTWLQHYENDYVDDYYKVIM